MSKSELKVSIVIPSYNTRDLLRKNLPKVISAKDFKKNNIMEIILVDDASPDDSANVVKKEFPQVKLIRHKVNRGFSSSVNTGARSSKGQLIALLNTDVIPEEDFLVSVLPYFKKRRVFAVSLNEKGGYSWARGFFKDGYVAHEPGEKTNEPHSTFWVSGGSGVFRRDYWMKLGGMDEKVFSPFYWEDLDLSYRAAKRGLELIWEPKAQVVHKHEATVSKLPKSYVDRIRERNHLLFIWKNITSPNLTRRHVVGLIKRFLRHPGYARIVIMALLRGSAVLKARAREKKESKVSDEAIFSTFQNG